MEPDSGVTRREFIKTAGVAMAGLALGGSVASAAEETTKTNRPNILWICTDQQRYDTIASHGNKYIRTPNLDRLASEGTAFAHAYCQSPVCTPSRASFLTGRYPRTTRAHQNGQAIAPDEVLVTKMLADAGYDCGLSGKLHIAPCNGRVEKRINDGYRVFDWSHQPSGNSKDNAYVKWLESKGHKWDDLYHPKGHAYAGIPAELHQTTWCIERAMDFIKSKHDGPWLMSVNIYAPHHPFDPPKEFLDRYDPDKLPDPAYKDGELANKPAFQRIDHDGAYGGGGMGFSKMTPRERREVTAAYYAMIEHIDDNVGRILKMLDDTGMRENTIVIFTSDHGELLGDHGIYLKGPYTYDCSIRVPLIISWPGHFKSGLRSDVLVELTDIAPTILEAVGMPIPNRVQGRPLTELLTGRTTRHRDQVFCESYNTKVRSKDKAEMVSMVRTKTHKIAVRHGTSEGELYDMQADPGEHDNLWDSPAHAGLKAEMMKRCFDASIATIDPVPMRVAPW